jgi:pimeloyl-ACP methyl ester carboxylesterase
MTDYLLVHGAGQGAWVWGRVWGYMTAPEEHPPTLHKTRRANHVYPMDLPGHGADAAGDTSGVRLADCVQAIVRAVEREELKDLVLVGHGFGGSLVLQAAQFLPQPPKRVVLVGGIVPADQRSLISACPRPVRTGFGLLSFLSSLSRREVKVPKPVIDRYLCNTMDPMEIAQMLGFMGALPTRVLKSRFVLTEEGLPCPVTYVVLTQNRLVSPESQRRIAARCDSEETLEIEACHEVMWQHPKELADLLLRYA